ncbi:MAG TPA: efflux transporter outer membrane subunit [Candidatus Sulfotelmatobacter sp.]|nr:efflux transporter outer membrane subunit [Candidatus Sulfotelmatobacter sp.]
MFSSCAVGPKYKRPALNVPSNFRGQDDTGTNSVADLPWWQVFHDEQLQSLIREALTNNYDLKIAVARMEQSRAAVAEARSQLFPQIGYAGAFGGGKNVSGGQPAPTGTEGTVFAADLNAAWQIDLFGRIRRQTEAARAQYFATREARRDIMVSLISQVAQDYFQLLALDRELQIARDSTNSFGDSLKIFRERLEHGIASKLETSSAEALLDNANASVPELEQQVALQENALNVLLGCNPGPVLRNTNSLDAETPPDVPAGLPSDLIERRPDIREAEQTLRAANAQVGVAVADFFPQLDLTGLFGQASTELAGLTAGQSLAWSAAASLTGPLFHGGQIRAQYQEARAARDQAAFQFQSTVLNALQEISNQLIARQKLAKSRDEQRKAVAAFQEAFKIAMERYQLGTSSYYEVLQQQQQLFPAEDTLVQTQLNQLLAVVQLYRALGGGWQADPVGSDH